MAAFIGYGRAAALILRETVKKIETTLNRLAWQDQIPPALCYGPVAVGNITYPIRNPPFINEDENDSNNGILWAVPRNRRTIERRLTRWLAEEKRIHPKKNLKVCEKCGHFHEYHTICGNCYERVKKETVELQEAILKKLQLNPVEKEVVVVYQNDKPNEKKLAGKIPVEVPKQRPSWFSPNLLSTVNPHRKVNNAELTREEPKIIVKESEN